MNGVRYNHHGWSSPLNYFQLLLILRISFLHTLCSVYCLRRSGGKSISRNVYRLVSHRHRNGFFVKSRWIMSRYIEKGVACCLFLFRCFRYSIEFVSATMCVRSWSQKQLHCKQHTHTQTMDVSMVRGIKRFNTTFSSSLHYYYYNYYIYLNESTCVIKPKPFGARYSAIGS